MKRSFPQSAARVQAASFVLLAYGAGFIGPAAGAASLAAQEVPTQTQGVA